MLIWDHGCYEDIAFDGVLHLLARKADEIGYWARQGDIQVVQAVRSMDIVMFFAIVASRSKTLVPAPKERELIEEMHI
jgi:hypothetical protein